jgi:hypothetical protein
MRLKGVGGRTGRITRHERAASTPAAASQQPTNPPPKSSIPCTGSPYVANLSLLPNTPSPAVRPDALLLIASTSSIYLPVAVSVLARRRP